MMLAKDMKARDALDIVLKEGLVYQRMELDRAMKRVKKLIKKRAKKGHTSVRISSLVEYMQGFPLDNFIAAMEADGFRVEEHEDVTYMDLTISWSPS